MVETATILKWRLLYWCMKKRTENIESPALGCKVGRAYHILLGQLADALRESGLDITTSEYLVLRAVFRYEGLQQCEIADMVGKDKAAVCRCVSSLINKGLLSAVSVSHKCLKIYLTDKSREIEPQIMSVAKAKHQWLAERTTPDELTIFSQILDKIINSK